MERQERCARGDAWWLAKNIIKLKATDKAFFFSQAYEWCRPAPSFITHGGNSVWTWVMPNWKQQSKEEATVCVKEMDSLVTVKLLEDTPADLSLGKLCEEYGYSCEWTTGQKPQLRQNGRRIQCSTENDVPIVVPGLSTGSSRSATPTSPTSISQEAVTCTLHPASTTSESTSSIEWKHLVTW